MKIPSFPKNMNIWGLALCLITVVFCIIVLINMDKERYKADAKHTRTIILIIEKMYAKGQVDALNGDIRVKKITDNKWILVESPWGDRGEPLKDTVAIIVK